MTSRCCGGAAGRYAMAVGRRRRGRADAFLAARLVGLLPARSRRSGSTSSTRASSPPGQGKPRASRSAARPPGCPRCRSWPTLSRCSTPRPSCGCGTSNRGGGGSTRSGPAPNATSTSSPAARSCGTSGPTRSPRSSTAGPAVRPRKTRVRPGHRRRAAAAAARGRPCPARPRAPAARLGRARRRHDSPRCRPSGWPGGRRPGCGSPRPTGRTTVGHIDVWADPGTGLPVQVEVTGRGAATPVLVSRFLDLSLRAPDPAVLVPPVATPGMTSRSPRAPTSPRRSSRWTWARCRPP